MMRGVFEKNMEKLSLRYPDLAERIMDSDSSSYQAVPSRMPGRFNLEHHSDGQYIPFYDPEDPFADVKSVLEGYSLERARMVILFGLGLGYQLWVLYRLLLEDGLLEDIIVFEKDISCFRLALEVVDLSDVLTDSRIRFVIGVEPNDLFVAMEHIIDDINVPKLKTAKFVVWPAVLKLFPEYYEDVKKALVDAANRWMTGRGNDPFDTLVAYEHFLKNNFEYLDNPGVSSLKGLFAGRPAVVVATGPSLNKNLHLLHSIKERVVILSADASLAILHKHGIQPHFVVVSERTPGIENFFKNNANLKETVLATVSFAHPTTLQAYNGPKIFMHRPYGFFDVLGLQEDVLTLGSHTASACFQLAAHMGCEPIILIGQDLAFGPSGLTHAEGCVFGEDQKFFDAGEDFLEVAGNVNETVRTNEQWYLFIKEYERLIADYGKTVINATEGGAKIEGTRIVPFNEAINQYCWDIIHPRERIMQKLASSRSVGSSDKMLQALDLIIDGIEECLVQAREGLNHIKDVLSSIAENESEDLSPILNEDIEAVLPKIYDIIDTIYYSGITQQLNEYFMTEIMPLFAEWLVIDERFQSLDWARAYRLKLAEDFLLTIGQICISLKRILLEGKKILESYSE
jgi:hypothetical protein